MASTLKDRLYHRYVKRWRFLYGWAKDARIRQRASARAAEWKTKGFVGAKLDVCGGRYPYKPGEFLNVDVADLPTVDLIFDIRRRFPIDSGVIAEILSVATLEHLREHDNVHVLKEFFRVLRPGGYLRVSTPDLEAMAKGVLAGDDLTVLNQYFFGRFKQGETEDLDVHRWMYPAPAMVKVLQDIGFERVRQIPFDLHLHDARYNYLIEAYKP